MPEPSRTVKYGGATLGVSSGNAIAYFGLQWLEYKHGFKFADPVVAMAMGGALVSIFFLELGKLGRGIKYVFDRIFPAKLPKE
jgi:hypothetical protein